MSIEFPDGARKRSSVSRKAHIREVLQRTSEIDIVTLANELGVSEMTIRRDLNELQRTGSVVRTHGGAVSSERMSFEFDFHQRRLTMLAEKRAIALEAKKLVKDGQRIILDTGTTTLELALELRTFKDLTVITPSLAVASALQFAEGVQVILLGGMLRRGQPDLTGGLTEQMLELFSADVLFQGADGIDRDGYLYNGDIQLSRVDKSMRQRSDRIYILADHTKIGQRALIRSGHLREVTALITDAGTTSEQAQRLKKNGVHYIAAPL